MDSDFDKEIDTLLRKAQRDGPVLVGDSSLHLDADELSAFAENAMPERARALQMTHLADCDRCRKILSNLLVMNAEVAPDAAASLSAITIAERALPWYKQLFLFPNLAYLMGSLVLVFGGFLAFTVLQNSELRDGAVVSQAPEPSTQGGPNFQVESELAETNSAANTTANVAVTGGMPIANSNTAATAMSDRESGVAGPRAGGENNFVLDGSSSADAVVSPPPPTVATAAPPAVKDARERDDLAKEKVEDKASGVALREQTKNDATMLKQRSISNLPSQSGPMRNNESQYNAQLENLERRAAQKKAGSRDEDSSSGRKVVGGKTFERKQGVWYDTTFQGRPTINVRRGTEEYNKLDGGLRSIANALGGTVVVVWGAKAYRIQ